MTNAQKTELKGLAVKMFNLLLDDSPDGLVAAAAGTENEKGWSFPNDEDLNDAIACELSEMLNSVEFPDQCEKLRDLWKEDELERLQEEENYKVISNTF